MDETVDGQQGAATSARMIIPATGRGSIVAPFDSAQAREAAARRWEQAGAAVRRGVAQAGDGDEWQALERAFYGHTVHAQDAAARGSAASLRLVMDYGYPKPAAQSSETPTGGATLTLSADAVSKLIEALSASHDGMTHSGGDASEHPR